MTNEEAERPTRVELSQAINKTVEFLLGGRDADGYWRDYDFRGVSDEWVTAYLAEPLAVAPTPGARRAAEEALSLLVEVQGETGGWQMGPDTPSDADSTAWTLRLAEALGRRQAAWIAAAYRFLQLHVQPEGGVSTYTMEVAEPDFRRQAFVKRWDGWCAPHDCVTAAVAGVRGFARRRALIDYLCRRQKASGAWATYWWHDREFTTALACEALFDWPGAEAAKARRLAAEWAAARIDDAGAVRTDLHPRGSPFATALAVRVLATVSDEGLARTRERALRWLLDSQLPTGGWQRSARLRVPPPGLRDPDSLPRWGLDGRGAHALGTIVVDAAGVHTAGTVLRALLAERDLDNR